MKTTLFILTTLFLLNSQKEKTGAITVSISNIKKAGKINVAIYVEGEGFPNDKYRVVANSKTCTATPCTFEFKNLSFGEYAIAVYQDTNNNGILDTGTFGIPSEPFAFSNNFRPRWGGPSYEKCKFRFEKDNQVTEIAMINSLFGGD